MSKQEIVHFIYRSYSVRCYVKMTMVWRITVTALSNTGFLRVMETGNLKDCPGSQGN